MKLEKADLVIQGEVFHEPVLIIVFETNPGRLIPDAAAFGWNLEELQQQRKLQIIFTSPEVFDQQLRTTESLLLEIANETLETGTVNI